MTVRYLTEEFEGVSEVLTSASKDLFSATTKLVYCSMKVCDDDVKFEEVYNLIEMMPVDVVMDVFDFFTDNISSLTEPSSSSKKKV